MRLAAFIGIAVLLVAAAFAVRARSAPAQSPPLPLAVGIGPLTEADFWALVDHSAAYEAQPEAQLADLRRELGRLTPEQIVGFEKQFDRLMGQSYSWELWG